MRDAVVLSPPAPRPRGPLARRVRATGSPRAAGRIAHVDGQRLLVRGLRLAIGDAVFVGDRRVVGEVLSVSSDGAHVAVYGRTRGFSRGDLVTRNDEGLQITAGADVIGRVLDGLGRPLDGRGPVSGERIGVSGDTPSALRRTRISEPLPVGVRALDTLTTVARGQRLGIFAGSGVGKSTLLGMMARGTVADINVIGLIGERGREVREFLEDDLGPEGLARSVVVVSTSDEPALVRLRAAFVATRLAEYFADGGADVLLMVDSLTRVAMAQRDVALAGGELPTSRGYPPSVMSTLLPELLERAGPREHGTVSALYTVLVEGDDMNDPVADNARSILDGHVVLDRRLATAGRYPPIDPLTSLSRSATKVLSAEQLHLAAELRRLLAAAEEVRDLVEVGAYVSGANPLADTALALRDDIEAFLRQGADDSVAAQTAWEQLAGLVQKAGGLR
jgi:flagellum-specific ATP synthase